MKQEKINKIRGSIDKLLQEKRIVTVIDIFIDIGILDFIDYEKWRKGQVDYLEMVCKANLSKLSKYINEIYKYVIELNLKLNTTYYKKYGKGKIKLRFSKSGDKKIEERYSGTFYKI